MESKLLFKPYAKQQEFIDAALSGKYTFLTYGGAMGGGKSFVSIALLIFLCKAYPRSKWVIIRDSVPTLKRTAIETFKKIVPVNFLKNFNQQDLIATFHNGSRIIFMAEDWASDKDFDRFKGLEVNGFLLEQIEELHEGILDVCLIRAGRWKINPMPKPIILATVNPTQNWVKKKIYEAFINGELPEDWFYLSATLMDNPELADDANYMNNIKNLDDITHRRHILGDWSAFAVNNPFAHAFDEKRHVSTEAKYDPMKQLYLSFDFNKDPITAIAAQFVGNDVTVIKEFSLKNSDIYELCDQIISAFPNVPYLVTGDATGRNRTALTKGNLNYYTVIKSKLRLTDMQLRVGSINPSVADTRVLLNGMLQNTNFVISSSCPLLIRDLKYVEVDENGDIKKDRSNVNKEADQLDCLRYLLFTFHRNFIKLL